ncbi:MAG TPA: hypothetical protein VK013_06610 [Myxococcaceae bacterium]|nr:hypothetical protein [Myxococcaceae bacterium]
MSARPVYVEVSRPDGSMEQVQVGTAEPRGDGFVLRLGSLRLGAAQPAAASFSGAAATGANMGDTSGGVFPNYGRSKGAPIRGASQSDLEFYANGARRSLNDPSKARWHEKERALLAQIEAELARQGAGGSTDDDGSLQGGSGGYFGEEPPPLGDDDLPF